MAVDAQMVLGWLRRLAAFDGRVFEDIRSNPTATIPAVAFALVFALTTQAIQSVTAAAQLRVLAANAAGFAVWAGALTLFVTGTDVYAPGVFVYVLPAQITGGLPSFSVPVATLLLR